MFKRLRLLIGRKNRFLSPKTLPNAEQPRPAPPTLDAVHEIAIYIHRFHNLDLFQQGWYKIKITMRWEDSEYMSPGTPARVVQYEAAASELCSETTYGVWRIDDTDNSFSTQPFRIRFARQDIFLSIMIAFNLSLGKSEGPSTTTAIILKFELMYAPVLEFDGSELHTSLDSCPAAVHEFRIPPKALLGLHSYCPVHFDSLHAVLIDISVHASLLKAYTPQSKLQYSSDSQADKDVAAENFDRLNQVASVDSEQIALIKALIDAHAILLEELQKISNAINQPVDLNDFTSKLDDMKMLSSILQENLGTVDGDASGQLSGEPLNGLKAANRIKDFQSDGLLHPLAWVDLLNSFQLLGNQVLYLWNIFLNFHRTNKTKILEFLRDTWDNDRRAEWSIWMVYLKADMPHHYLSSGVGESSNRVLRGKALSLLKLNDDPAENAAMRAEHHRRSIAQMRMNNSSIQDMHIFEDPSHVPIVIVERVMNVQLRSTSGNSYFSNLDKKDKHSLFNGPSFKAVNQLSEASLQQNGRILKIVVFVHGFQGNHLDLRLVRNQWLLIDPTIQFLMSEVNEDKTYEDFREMGLRLAQEVISFLKMKMDKVSRFGCVRNIRLSFVGHSIGNIIIRTALAESIMEPYLRYLYTYVSVSGPHLGYLYSSNSLFNSGLWLLKKLKDVQCIHQLTFTDDPELQNTFLYKLCKQRTLENFKNIILISSPQDGYVPYHSARIEFCQSSLCDNSKKGNVFLEMLNNCMDQIRAPSSEHRVFMRCDINFDTPSHGKNFSSIIGRAAHVEFLESDIFARLIMWSFPELFR